MINWLSLHQLSLAWFVPMINTTIISSILLVGAITINRYLKQLSAGFRFLLLLLALNSLVAVPAFYSFIPAVKTKPVPSYQLISEPPAVAKAIFQNPIKPQIYLKSDFSKNYPLPLSTWFFLIWVAGLIVMGFRILSGIWGMYHLLTAKQNQNRITIDFSRGMKIKTAIRSGLHTPITCGLFHPIVFLPESFPEWSGEQKRAVLHHEAAHIKRYDNLTNLLTQIIVTLNWFNPLAWITLNQIRVTREKACDDYVLNAGIKPSVYAGILFDAIRASRMPNFKHPNLITLQFNSKGEKRLKHILDNTINHCLLHRGLKILVLLITLALFIPLSALQLFAAAEDSPIQTDSDYQEIRPEITIVGNTINVSLCETLFDGNNSKIDLSGSINEFPVGWPEKDIRNPIVCFYGFGIHPIFGNRRHHDGVDIHSNFRTPLVATADGVVVRAQWWGGYGNCVEVQHRYLLTRYGHFEEITVKPGDTVKRGDLLGYSGNTGVTTGPHLHYEIQYDSKPLDPKYFFDVGSSLR